MGEPVTVVESPSSRHGVVRFETNRNFTGMGHERYVVDTEVVGDRPPDAIARLLFDTGKVSKVHVYAQTITVTLDQGADSSGLADLLRDLYIHYKPGVRVPVPEDFA